MNPVTIAQRLFKIRQIGSQVFKSFSFLYWQTSNSWGLLISRAATRGPPPSSASTPRTASRWTPPMTPTTQTSTLRTPTPTTPMTKKPDQRGGSFLERTTMMNRAQTVYKTMTQILWGFELQKTDLFLSFLVCLWITSSSKRNIQALS